MGGAVIYDGEMLALALREPGSTGTLDARGWTALIAIARAEQLAGTLAHRLDDMPMPMPEAVARIMTDARASAAQGRITALWEAEMARRVLTSLGCPVVLLKGAAFAAAGLAAGEGRSIGDLDILVPRDRLADVEAALLDAGWEWVKPDPYDDAYYRRWMHELPPLIHRDRDRMIDVHHTILPLTARITPDVDALIADSVVLESGLRVLAPEDMVCHAAAHLFADGDLAGGMRNLWDIDRLCRDFTGRDPDFCASVLKRARHHGLQASVKRAFRLALQLYGTPVTQPRLPIRHADEFYRRRFTARDGWGRPTRPLLRQAFYLRSHWLRMPPAMLARHLWTKWRNGYRPVG